MPQEPSRAARVPQGGQQPAREEREIFGQIFHEVEMHIAVEEEIFFPALREASTRGLGAVDEASKDHREIESVLNELANLEPREAEFESSIALLRERVEGHFEREKKEIFPLAEEALAGRSSEDLAALVASRKSFLHGSAKRFLS